MRWLHRNLLLRIDPERAHRLATAGTQCLTGLLGSSRSIRFIEQMVGMREELRPLSAQVGLAGGFDKNAEWLPILPAFGFGFAEIGTVTPRPQSGNQIPRLWRVDGQGALFNRMGFNNDGAHLIAERLRLAKPQLPNHFQTWINLGKNADTPGDRAHEDYAASARLLAPFADAWVINVSSPNTAGLRQLQTVDAIGKILSGMREWSDRPLYIKLAPEIDAVGLKEIITGVEQQHQIEGWVLTNTIAGEWTLVDGSRRTGGWSGSLLKELSRLRLKEARGLTRKRLISVGGIDGADEVDLRLKLGADAVQIYTAFVFGGPDWVVQTLEGLLQKRKQP